MLTDKRYINKKEGFVEKAKSYLFKSRRAKMLSKYRESKEIIEEHLPNNPTRKEWDEFLKKNRGAISTFSESLRFQHINHSMMEMDVCMSVSP